MSDNYYERLARKRERMVEEKRQELLPRWHQRKLGEIVRRRLRRAADGLPQTPVGCEDENRIVIPSRTWARLIVRAACVFEILPGFVALDKHPLPDTQCGSLAGERILAIARRTRDVAKVAAEIDQARAALGQYPSEPPRGHLCDYDYGIWSFFRQLDRYFDGVSWSPPMSARRSAQSVRRQRASQSPLPTLPALKNALHTLGSMSRSEEVDVKMAISLYGLSGVSSKGFVDSSKYVQRHGQDKKAWQLPRRQALDRNSSGAKPVPFKAQLRWSVKDVRTAIRGWIERLDV